MGRTLPTFRNVLDRLYVDWGEYRRALRGPERDAFDALFRKAKNHASASQLVAEPEPIHAMLLSVLLEHELELAKLRAARADAPRDEASADG